MNITLFKSIKQAYFTDDDTVSDSWENIAEFLLEHHTVPSKDSAPMFNCWQFKQAGPDTEEGRRYEFDRVLKISNKSKWTPIPNTIRRCKDNVVGVWGLVLDYDNGMSFEDAKTNLQGIECVLYTTFNHTAANNKFRVVIPFSRMMTADEFKLKEESIRNTFECVDDSTFDLSRAFYMHSGPFAKTYWSKGAILNPEDFPNTAVTTKKAYDLNQDREFRAYTDEELKNHQAKTLLALSKCKNLHYSNGLTLASICKSVGLNFTDFQMIVNAIKSPDSGLSDENWQNDLWLNAAPRITVVNRDKFLVKHGSYAMSNNNISTWREDRDRLYNKYIALKNK